ncbi:MAG: hypothetical protein C5B51_00190 [Terriglobia bacterium]|nr:MAG: hypothetical protein C5B51_00190 [Terriglobia bacterium]
MLLWYLFRQYLIFFGPSAALDQRARESPLAALRVNIGVYLGTGENWHITLPLGLLVDVRDLNYVMLGLFLAGWFRAGPLFP